MDKRTESLKKEVREHRLYRECAWCGRMINVSVWQDIYRPHGTGEPFSRCEGSSKGYHAHLVKAGLI